MNPAWFSQSDFRCRMEWGREGARAAAGRGDMLVVVDTLRFSTAVATAVHHGAVVYPCLETEDVEAVARRVGAEAAGQGAGAQSRYSLSPLSYLGIEPGTRVALASPNGATCSLYAAAVPYLFVGALVNAAAVAGAVSAILDHSDLCVTVLACGERWPSPSEDGALRFAIEDALGAGAILAGLRHSASPEAAVCAGAFLHARARLPELLAECGSGVELREKGRADDVRHSARLDLYDTVPMMRAEGRGTSAATSGAQRRLRASVRAENGDGCSQPLEPLCSIVRFSASSLVS